MVTHTQACSAPTYEAIADRNVMMPLRDGVRLAMDIYFPSINGVRVEGEFPAVLTRTPYDKNGGAADAKYFAERGYVAVMQDVRGRYESEGEFYAFAHEGPDGYDTVEWIAAQAWCNGKVGTMGASYCGAVQSALASLNPPHLAAMIPTYGPGSYFHSSMRHNGVLEMRFHVYAFTMAARSREAAADLKLKAALDEANANIWDWVKAYPIRRGNSPLHLVPSYEQWCIDIATHTTYDDYWKQPGYGPRPYYDQHADVPTLYVGGWYDTYTRNTLENFVELRKRQNAPVHVLMGPWTHSTATGQTAGNASFAPDGGLSDFRAVELRWFDQWLKGLPTGLDQAVPVKYFLMGGGSGPEDGSRTIYHGGEWKSSETWPPAGAEATPFYFHADGTLSLDPPVDEPEPTVYQFDPSDPVPTIGGHLSAIAVPAGGFDQRNEARFLFAKGKLPLSARQDILCFVTEPLAQDVAIAGPIRVRIWVSTDGPDTDFTAKLMDIYPPSVNYPHGCALNLTDSIMRLRFRNGFEREELGEPGEAYLLDFEMYPNANRFVRGHQIRVDISSSNYPRFEVNPNTGGTLGVDRCKRVAQNSLYHSSSKPSHIVLPVMSV